MSTSHLDPSVQIGELRKMQPSRVKSPVSCTPSSLATASYSFSSFYAQGKLLPHSPASASMLRPPPPEPEKGSPHSPSSLLLGCWAGMAGHTLRYKVSTSQNVQPSRATPSQPLPDPVSSSSPSERKKRASLSRGKHHLAIFRAPRPNPAPAPAARDLVQKSHLGDG